MEEWKYIPNTDNAYMISNFGRVKSKNGIKSQSAGNSGYLQVDLYVNGKRTRPLVHRLVAKSFITNEFNKPEVNHIDENKLNNQADNLEWVTRKENMLHGTAMVRNGIVHRKGIIRERNGLMVPFDSTKSCAEITGIGRGGIANVLCGISKTSGGYKFYKKTLEVEYEIRRI